MERWTFLTNHAHVLLCLSLDPEIRLRDVADRVGITERATQRIVADLVSEGYITSERVGRRNKYVVHSEVALRHPIEEHQAVGVLLELMEKRSHPRRRNRSKPAAQRGSRSRSHSAGQD